MSIESICPCDEFVFPLVVTNVPSLPTIKYRVGDFTSFRHAMLVTPRLGEIELINWRPCATQDLAVQMVEWWAYLADILTFYNERIANQDYLRTADLPESVSRLIRVLGYRPRAGIGAVGTVAALLGKQVALTLPKGFQIQSKPGPGLQPQIFELDADTTINPPDFVSADIAPDPSLLQTDASTGLLSVLLAGTVTSIQQGDELLLLARVWNGSDPTWALAVVQTVALKKDPRGRTITQVIFANSLSLPSGVAAANYRLLKSTQFARPWQTANANVTLTASTVDLDSIARGIKVGDPLLFEIPGGSPGPLLVSVTEYTEAVWYLNAPDASHPQTSPDPATVPPVPIPHSEITFAGSQSANWPLTRLEVRYAWQDVGNLIAAPANSLNAAALSLVATPPASFPSGDGVPVILEDANGIGTTGSGSVAGSPPTMRLSALPAQSLSLTPPINVLYGLLQVSRGKTVVNEILGSGVATQAGQEFVLKNSPLTYLLGASSISGQNYSSTLTVRVNGVAWQEVQSFFDQPPDACVYVTREDENNQTHVMFGDGINGTRLPSGINNVVAGYRFGSGATSPPAGSLTVILQPRPNLRAIHNPVVVGGGADPDPPAQIRRYAPNSVLTFGRAISADDYETIAAQAPGVVRARSYFAYDAIQQRAMVTIYVGDEPEAVVAAQTALSLGDDPNRPVAVKLAAPVPVQLNLTLLVDPRYDVPTVIASVNAALADPGAGLFGASIGIGETIYDSQIYQVCLSVAGAVAVHGLEFVRFGVVDANESHSPGVGGFFQLTTNSLAISPEVAANAG